MFSVRAPHENRHALFFGHGLLILPASADGEDNTTRLSEVPFRRTWEPGYLTGFRSETVEKVAMTRLIRNLSVDSVAGHV